MITQKTLPGQNNQEDAIKRILDEFIIDTKRAFMEGDFISSLWMLINTTGTMRLVRIPGSEKVFEYRGDQKIQKMKGVGRIGMMAIKATLFPDAELIAIITAADAFFVVKESPKTESMDDIINAPGYLPPADDPDHLNALVISPCFRDHTDCFAYEYEEINGRVVFNDNHGILDGLADVATGNLCEIFPDL